MKYLFRFVSILIFTISISSCSFLNTVFKEQQWSRNYVLAEGVEANDPAFIDGDLGTIGESQFPDISQRGGGLVTGSDFPSSEAVVILPEKKHIYKIVIYTTNMQTFDILIRDESRGWEKIKTVKSNKDEKISLKLKEVAITDGIKLRVERTSDDAAQRRKNVRRLRGWTVITGNIRSPAKIREIELYGYVNPDEKSQEDIEVDLDEVNELLKE